MIRYSPPILFVKYPKEILASGSAKVALLPPYPTCPNGVYSFEEITIFPLLDIKKIPFRDFSIESKKFPSSKSVLPMLI